MRINRPLDLGPAATGLSAGLPWVESMEGINPELGPVDKGCGHNSRNLSQPICPPWGAGSINIPYAMRSTI